MMVQNKCTSARALFAYYMFDTISLIYSRNSPKHENDGISKGAK